MLNTQEPIVMNIALAEIRPSKDALRKVDTASVKYKEMVDSIKQVGILNAVCVRPKVDAETGATYYELIEGGHRWTGACEAGLASIPATVRDMSDVESYQAMVIGNLQKQETKPCEYAAMIKRIMSMKPGLTTNELAGMFGASRAFIDARLTLNDITDPNLKTLIDSGEIKVQNAYMLAKLPEDEQAAFATAAQREDIAVFGEQVIKRVKEINEANRQGRAAKSAEFVPVAFARRLKDMKDAVDNDSFANELVALYSLTDPVSAVKLALQFAIHLDPKSVDEQRGKFEARKNQQEEEKKKRAAAKVATLAKKAAEAQAALGAPVTA